MQTQLLKSAPGESTNMQQHEDEDHTIVHRCGIIRLNDISIDSIKNLVRWIAVRMKWDLIDVRQALIEAELEEEIKEAMPAVSLTLHRIPTPSERFDTVKAASGIFISKALRQSYYCYRHPALYAVMSKYSEIGRSSCAVSP